MRRSRFAKPQVAIGESFQPNSLIMFTRKGSYLEHCSSRAMYIFSPMSQARNVYHLLVRCNSSLAKNDID
jgi:hypothetical protein